MTKSVHSRLRRALATVAVAVLVGLGVTSFGVGGASAAESDTIATLVNQARASAGLPGLIRNPAMDAVAVQWANQMGAANSMTHNPAYSTQIPAGWSKAGENVAMGQPTAGAMHTAWMNSAGHRANILGDFTDIGIAFVTINGTTWGVEDFGTYAGHVGAPAPAAARAPVAEPAAKAVMVAPTPVATALPPPAPPAPSASAVVPPPTPAASISAAPTNAGSTDRTLVSASAAPRSSGALVLAASDSTAKPFPVGYIIGGLLVVLGIAGGIYGNMLRIRGRRPPDWYSKKK